MSLLKSLFRPSRRVASTYTLNVALLTNTVGVVVFTILAVISDNLAERVSAGFGVLVLLVGFVLVRGRPRLSLLLSGLAYLAVWVAWFVPFSMDMNATIDAVPVIALIGAVANVQAILHHRSEQIEERMR